MTTTQLIESLLGITVTTSDLDELRSNPESYVTDPADADKLKDLFMLLEMEVKSDVQLR